MTTHQVSLEMEPRSDQARIARRRVVGLCSGMGRDQTEDAELLVSELVANAIQHGPRGLKLTAVRIPQQLRVDVCEEAPAPSAMTGACVPTQRPCHVILERLATVWGEQSATEGTARTVWFTLDAPGAR